MAIFEQCLAKFGSLSVICNAGFSLVDGGKGSHRKFRHPNVAGLVILSGHDGDDARHYQEKQVRRAIEASKS